MECDKVQCGICIEEVDAGKILRYCGGKHVFCMNCMDQWLNNREEEEENVSLLNAVSCPICRQSIYIYTGYPDGVHTQYSYIKKRDMHPQEEESEGEDGDGDEGEEEEEDEDEDEGEEEEEDEDEDEDEEEEEKKDDKRSLREFTVKNGELHGRFREFYPNSPTFDCSVPKLEVKYVHGEKSGMETRWNCLGYIVSQTKYRNGMKNGLHTEWVPKMDMDLEGTSIEYGPTFIKMLMEDRVKVTECTYVNDCLDGKVTEWYDDDGQLKSVSYYLGGIENGIFTTWYPDGKKKSIGHYIMGKMQGYYYQWHPNGVISYIVYYIDDQPHGRYYQWNEKGKLIGLYYYRKGEYHGPCKEWSDQGFLLKETTYHHGVIRGKLIKYFYNSDKIYEIAEFDDDGKLHGVNEQWHPIDLCEGGVSRRCWRAHYVHGKKEGVYERWQTYGVGGDGEGLMERETFSDDKQNGLYQSWWPNGNLSCRYRDGLFQRWHENGVLSEQYFSIKDRAEGLHTKWYDNGVKENEVMLVHDEPVGIYREWDREGVLIEERDYGDRKADLIH